MDSSVVVAVVAVVLGLAGLAVLMHYRKRLQEETRRQRLDQVPQILDTARERITGETLSETATRRIRQALQALAAALPHQSPPRAPDPVRARDELDTTGRRRPASRRGKRR